MARAGTLTGCHDLIILNEILSFCCFLVACMTVVRHVPTAVLALFFLSLLVGRMISSEVMSSQFIPLLILVMTFLWIYAIIIRSLYDSVTREIDDYKSLQTSILEMFNMSRTEMASLVHLCLKSGHNPDLDRKMVAKLSEQTRHNLIGLQEYLLNERRDRKINLSVIFPQLTATELDVCRLVLKGKTLREIAEALDKTMSNIGTVRGNIRRKLGLTTDEDLRAALLRRISGDNMAEAVTVSPGNVG